MQLLLWSAPFLEAAICPQLCPDMYSAAPRVLESVLEVMIKLSDVFVSFVKYEGAALCQIVAGPALCASRAIYCALLWLCVIVLLVTLNLWLMFALCCQCARTYCDLSVEQMSHFRRGAVALCSKSMIARHTYSGQLDFDIECLILLELFNAAPQGCET